MELLFVRNESGNCTTVPGNKTVLALVSWCPEGKSWDLEAVLDPFCGEPCVRCIVRGVCVCACVCVMCMPLQFSGSQLGAILPSGRHLAMSGDIFGGHCWEKGSGN